MDKVKQTWNYYRENNKERNTNKDGNATPFSLNFFYEAVKEETLNSITRAFLGDDTAYDAIQAATFDDAGIKTERVRKFFESQKIPPNASQIRAIADAARNDITIVQGPPGTGKTKTIRNLLAYLLSEKPHSRIAVVSSNREAINNIVEEAKTNPDLKDSCALLGNRKLRQEFKKALDESDPELSRKCSRDISLNADYSNWVFSAELLERYPIIFCTIHSLRNCIIEDDTFHNQYDYVIVDECSQVGSVLGILAMASARHLVLFGDNEQLSPIHKGVEKTNESYRDKIASYYLDEGDNNFMRACEEHFGEKAGRVMLDEHYRCHPAIIGFCNEYIYDHKLKIRTTDTGDERLPIRIRWYEGDYWEIDETPKADSENVKKEHYNRKQIEIFMEEEYPDIVRKILEYRNDSGYSVCVLAPYKRQLAELKQRLEQYNREHFGDDMRLHIDPEISEGEESVEDLMQLTIHKAQGREYDMVIILPVVDSGENPWPQRKRLINVAVSRAKKELCVITSSTWLPAEIQRQMTGYAARIPGDDGELYLKRLIEYTARKQEELTGKGIEADGEYGLVRSKHVSVFDKIPYYRQNAKPEGRNTGKTHLKSIRDVSAPERCMHKALQDESALADYEILTEVRLSDIEGLMSEVEKHREEMEDIRAYIENGACFDFALCKNGHIVYIIEVDGAYHRTESVNRENDVKKDKAATCLGESFYQNRYTRFPTDGSTKNEIQKIIGALTQTMDEEQLPRMMGMHETGGSKVKVESNAIEFLKEEMQRILREFKEEMESGDDEERKGQFEKIKAMRFDGGALPDYSDPLQVNLYLLRYAMTYAFEYSIMYQIALKLLEKEKHITVYSFGCGSQLDGVSLAYASGKAWDTGKDNRRISYRGIDLEKWPVHFPLEGLLDQNTFFEKGMEVFLKEEFQTLGCNILCFPKILSEGLDQSENGAPSVIDVFCEELEKKPLKRDTVLVCVSYRGKDTMAYDMRIAGKVFDALKKKGYVPESDWNSVLSSMQMPGDVHKRLSIGYDEEEGLKEFPYFYFSEEDSKKKCSAFDSEFELPEEIRKYLNYPGHIMKQCENYEEVRKKYEKVSEDGEIIKKYNNPYPRTICDVGCLMSKEKKCYLIPREKINDMCFQVIPFKKKKEE